MNKFIIYMSKPEQFISFPKIEQFRKVCTEVKYHYDNDTPTIRFKGTVKVHGTNAGVSWDFKNKICPQSRNRLITVENDNAGFAKFVKEKEVNIINIMKKIAILYPGHDSEILYLYGEWCGKGIQARVAVAELSPRFIVFDAMYIDTRDPNDLIRRWLPQESLNVIQDEDGIYSIYRFTYWEKDITFKQPELSQIQNDLEVLTKHVEQKCPVGAYFGVSGVGEGIVWKASIISPRDSKLHHLCFKVKGTQHSSCKASSRAAINVEKLVNIDDFIKYAVTENRMEQGYDELHTKTNTPPCREQIGNFIKWVRNDVLKEESDTIKANGFKERDVSRAISNIARVFYDRKYWAWFWASLRHDDDDEDIDNDGY